MDNLSKKKMKAFLVVSRYNEDVSWVKKYTTNYVVYNKGKDDLPGYKVKKVPNFGGNQFDMCSYIYDNYNDLPEFIAFVQGFPFDHCNRKKFNKIITNTSFTSLESYEKYIIEQNNPKVCRLSVGYDAGFMEVNNSWYIKTLNEKVRSKGLPITCPFNSFDDFMNYLFVDYDHLDYIRFAPGSQYLVEKRQCLYYSRRFWKALMNFFSPVIGLNGGTEGHLVERSLWLIFNNIYTLKGKI